MKPIISIIMGSKSDWSTMQKTAEVLDRFGVAYEKKVVSAHRTPDLMFQHAEEARSRGIKVIIAGAGGAAHLPGMVAAKTTLPVIGVPVKSRALSGLDSLYSIVQMPGGVPVSTMAIGEAGATNAALTALRILAIEDQDLAVALADFAEEAMSSSKTIGIIGGGQLGQMMAISAIYMGHKAIALDPAADCPASRVAEIIVAPYNDVDALRQLAERCDVLTYEFENVDADGLDAVIKDGQLPQGTDLLRISQNRIFEKDFLSNKAQVTVAPYKVVTSSQDLADIDLLKNYVLKTATGGYDGHGQKVIRSVADLEEAYALADSADCVLEEFVNFDLEISVIVSGNGKDVTVFPVQENIHRNNILSKTIVPARISDSLAEKAKTMAVRIAEQLNLSGTLCVEMFATADDIVVNEIAPRPHNSGHYSIEACDFSQFDTHILGVLGAPLPAIHLLAPAVMLNVLGQHVEAAEKYVTENPSAHLHLYGKIEAKHNRKMGHVTLFSSEPDEVEEFGKGIDF